MRNLKKFLALVLAMMMTLSLMVTVNAAAVSDFTDADEITDEFREGVAVLEGLGVFTGYTNGDEFDFRPQRNITRAEVAAIVYRLATGDVKGNQAHLYKDYQKFNDVTASHWAAGYINYCANAEWIAGYGNGKFGPNDNVTGYQAAAMILRAVGYGKNNEFKGSGWQVQVANVTRSKGLLVNVDNTTYANTLNQAAPRELVAEILFQAGLIDTVSWTMLQGYQPEGNRGLAWQNFKLNVGGWETIDKWGRPGYYWFKNTNTVANRVATIKLDPDLEFDTTWKECDVAHELDFDGSEKFYLYVNNYRSSTDKYRIEATDTVTRVGGQGRETEFYGFGGEAHPWSGLYNDDKASLPQQVVMIDTYLATVTRVTERVLDPQGHVVTPAYLYLNVHDGHGVGPEKLSGVFFASGSAAEVNTTTHRVSDMNANFSYVAGDKVLVRGYSDPAQWEDVGSVPTKGNTSNAAKDVGYTKANGVDVADNENLTDITGLNHIATQALIEQEAFEANCLLPSGTNYANDDLAYTKPGSTAIEVVQKAESKTAKQTVTYWNQGKHTTDAGEFNDAMTLFLDAAGTTTGTTFAWYFDTKGNLIGIDNVPNTVNFGVITSIYSAFDQGENATTGTAKAIANVKYADGSTGTVTIDRFLVGGTSVGTGTAPVTPGSGHNTAGTTMTSASGTLDLVPVYDYTGTNVMGTTSRTGTPTNAQVNGYLHVAPVAAVNATENGNTAPYHGILLGNLFKFVASSDGKVTAIEVAGGNANTGVYDGHYNSAINATNAKIVKNAGYITLDGSTAGVWLDVDATIMIRASASSTAVACYKLDALPGDVNLANSTEIDWADTDNDGRAEYVYVTGTSTGTLTYGLFYYNGGAAQWNGVDKTGTIAGWLNGEPATLTFQGETTFSKVRDSQSYVGHLFAVEMTNGVVSAVMAENANGYQLLTNADNTTISNFGSTIKYLNATGTSVPFQVGTQNGNPYSATTKAIYLKDTAGTNVTYNAVNQTISDGNNKTYYLTLNSKVIGLGMGVNQDSAILDYLNKSTTNDVTIVYEEGSTATSGRAVLEIYVATDPNVTPTPVGGNLALSNVSMVGNVLNYTVTNNYSAAVTPTYTVEKRIAGTTTWTVAATASISSIASGASATQTYTVTGVTGSAQTYEVRVIIGCIDPVTGGSVSATSGIYTAII